jgi:polyphosphate glucokinase
VTVTKDPSIGIGVDIGGSGMKAALVDLHTGSLASERLRIDTPKPATPTAMLGVLVELVSRLDHPGRVGCAFPAVVRHGIVGSAANIDASWIDVDAGTMFSRATGRDVVVLNDADAAGTAEITFGSGKGVAGVVLVLTFGTGIGSGLFVDGRLVPNTELGHLELDGTDAESRASAKARERDRLSWRKWASRVQRYLEHVERILSPELIVVGGGASKEADRWLPSIDIATPIVPARMQNSAGIVGAALAAQTGVDPGSTAPAR